MFKRVLLISLLAGPGALRAGEGDDEAFLQGLLDGGYLQIAKAYHEGHSGELSDFAKKLMTLKFLEAEVAAGNNSKKAEVDRLRAELIGSITRENLDPDKLNLKYDYALSLIEAGDYDQGIEHMEFFSGNVMAVIRELEAGGKRSELNVKFIDSDLHIGRAYFKLAQAEEDVEKKSDLLYQAEEGIGDYIYGCGQAFDFAVLAYPDLLRLVVETDKADTSEYPLEDVIDMMLTDKHEEGTWRPIWHAHGNPASLPAIFETAKVCVELQSSENDKLKLAKSLLKDLSNKIKLDPEPSYYMGHQHHLELAKFCAFVVNDLGLPDSRTSTFLKNGQDFIKKTFVPLDFSPAKSPYATQAVAVANSLQMEVEAVTLGDPLLQSALDHVAAKRFTAGRRAFERLLHTSAEGTARRAMLWFYIGVCYYQSDEFLQASLAFEKSWETDPSWAENPERNGQAAFDLSENAAKRFATARRDFFAEANLQDKDLEKALRVADRDFAQTVRKRVFSHRKGTEQGISALYFWATNMYLSNYIENNTQKAYDAFAEIPADSKYRGEALYYMFQCGFNLYQDAAEGSPERQALFEQASNNAEKLFAMTEGLDAKNPDNDTLLKLDAAARTTVVQLYLLEPSKAQDAKDLLEGLVERYGKWLGEAETRRVPAWKIEARVNIGTAEAIEDAVKMWDAWQKKIMRDNKDKPNDLLVSTTQLLANKGIKAWMGNNDTSHARYGQIAKLNTKVSQWIRDNVKFTPILLVQLALIDKNNKQWRGVSANTELFIEKYENDASWQRDPEAKKYAPQMYLWQVEALQKINTAESWLKAADCLAGFNERTPHSTYRRRQADALVTAAELLVKAGKESEAGEHFAKARGMYNILRRAKGSHDLGTENWWSSYEMTFRCLVGLKDYDQLTQAIVGLRYDVTDNEKRRNWLKGWIQRASQVVGPDNRSLLSALADNLVTDYEDMLKNLEDLDTTSPEPEPAPDDNTN